MSVEDRFWVLFERTMGRRYERANCAADSIEEWDSLTHVELIFELESEFGVQFSQEEIAEYYSDTNHLVDFLKSKSVES